MLNRKNISNSVKYGILVGALVVTALSAYEARKLYVSSKIDAVVDVDGDYDASKSEWGVVYNALGVENTGRRGEDLGLGQLEKFLEMKDGE